MRSGDVVYHKLTGEAFILLEIRGGTISTCYRDTCTVRDARYETASFFVLELQPEQDVPEEKRVTRKLAL